MSITARITPLLQRLKMPIKSELEDINVPSIPFHEMIFSEMQRYGDEVALVIKFFIAIIFEKFSKKEEETVYL